MANADVIKKIDEAKNEIVATVLQSMENIITKTISVLKSDFDSKILHLQNSLQSPRTMINSFVLAPVQTIEQLEELDSKLEDLAYAENLVG